MEDVKNYLTLRVPKLVGLTFIRGLANTCQHTKATTGSFKVDFFLSLFGYRAVLEGIQCVLEGISIIQCFSCQ